MNITKEEFKNALTDLVAEYLGEDAPFVDNPQIRVNPMDHTIAAVSGEEFLNEIADSDEAVEDASHADGPEEDAADYQASRNPDFYPVRQFVKEKDGKFELNRKEIDVIADTYFR